MLKVAILDDYAKVALKSADWSVLQGKAEVTVFDRHLSEDEAVSLLAPFDVLCTVRERMSMPRSLFARLPNLKLVTIIGMALPNLDMAAATEHGVIGRLPMQVIIPGCRGEDELHSSLRSRSLPLP